MNLRRLHCFVIAVEEGNFGRAADRLHIAHSAFSRQIAHLEDELGVKLFNRLGRRVVLSPAGQAYVERVRPILAALNEAAAEVRGMQSERNTSVAIGVQEHIGSYPSVVRALQLLRGDIGDIAVTVQPAGSLEIVRALGERRIDLGFIYGEPALLQGVDHRAIGYDRYLLAMPDDHPLARRPAIRQADIAAEPFIHIDSDVNQGLQQQWLRCCRAAGFEPRIAQRTPRVSGLVSLIAAGVGVAFMPEMIAAPPGVYRCVVDDLSIPIPLALIWREDESRPHVRSVVEACSRSLRESIARPVDFEHWTHDGEA